MNNQVEGSQLLFQIIAPHTVLPVYLDDQILIEKFTPKTNCFRRKPDISPFNCISFCDVNLNRHKRYLGRFTGEQRYEMAQSFYIL